MSTRDREEMLRSYPKPPPEALMRIAREYHESCELYDQTVCSARSPRTGFAIPVDGWERGKIGKYAMNLRKMLNDKAESLGYSREEFNEALKIDADLFEKDRKRHR